MIKHDEIIKNGKKFIRTYSDENKYILQKPTNIRYKEAVDVENAPYTYVEVEDSNVKVLQKH